MSTTHIAAQEIIIENRYQRQLCAWCGEKLMDNDLSLIAVPEGQDPTPGAFPCGKQVRVTKGFPTSYIVLDEDKLTKDSCFDALAGRK